MWHYDNFRQNFRPILGAGTYLSILLTTKIFETTLFVLQEIICNSVKLYRTFIHINKLLTMKT